MSHMHPQAAVLGSDFSNWARLTEQYSEGLDALRRREPGASARMAEIARQLNHYALRIGEQPLPPIPVETAARLPLVGSTWGQLAMAAMQALPRLRVRRMLSLVTMPS